MSTAKFDTLQNAAGTKSVPVGSTVVDGSAKAWVNFNGTGTVAIRASGNVSSITDNGVGAYQVNYTTAMPDTNYAYFISGIQNSVAAFYNALLKQRGTTSTTTSLIIEALLITSASSAAAFDVSEIQVTIFR